MGKLSIVKFGDKLGAGAIVQESGWFSTKTYTMLAGSSPLFNKWVCIETGYSGYCIASMERINDFYRSQYETR